MDQQQLPPNHHANYPASPVPLGSSPRSAWPSVARVTRSWPQSGLRSGDTVVDIGCGPGVAVRYSARLGATVTGIDPAPVMLRVARRLTRRTPKVRYIEGSAEAIPLPDGCASIVWTVATVHHWSDISAGLREARRVLVPGGRLVAMERRTQQGARGHASHGWTDEQATAFMDRCLDHGFADVHPERAPSGRRSMVAVVASVP